MEWIAQKLKLFEKKMNSNTKHSRNHLKRIDFYVISQFSNSNDWAWAPLTSLTDITFFTTHGNVLMIATKIDWSIAFNTIRRIYQRRAILIKWNFIGKLNEFAELFTFSNLMAKHVCFLFYSSCSTCRPSWNNTPKLSAFKTQAKNAKTISYAIKAYTQKNFMIE